MPRFRLRYQSTDLEMPVGEFVVGRSSSCHLALDDALVSRRHAIFHVSPGGGEVEDLGSRNGVQVNGAPIKGRMTLKHLDRVIIGAQELLLVRVQSEGRGRGARPTLAGMTLDLPVIGAKSDIDEPTVHHKSGSVLDRIADKALALGRYEEAERMLGRRLKSMLEEVSEDGHSLTEDKRRLCTSYALKLAQGTGKSEWVDWIFAIHDACEALPSAEVVDDLHDLVRRIRYPGSAAFRDYMANTRDRIESLSKAERFLLQRLEGVERVIGA